MTISTNPPRGTADRYPEEFRIRKYIFDTWRTVCQSFGYEEYLGPLVEDSAIWKAKSGEDVGGTELTLLTDREGNISDLALRPEMTPTVTRMVSKKRNELPKPTRWFSIANFYRNERPQRGRNREFRQLNVDLFGDMSLGADREVLIMALELMQAFGATAEHIVLSLNHRELIDIFLLEVANVAAEDKQQIVRIMDKREKMDEGKFIATLSDMHINKNAIANIVKFMRVETIDAFVSLFPRMETVPGLAQLRTLLDDLAQLGYADYVAFKPSLMRGFDYYDGMVFEVFDKHPDNNRALFGGGRYNGLAEIFGVKEPIPAVGFAPGDEPMKLFLESWGLDTNISTQQSTIYIPLLDDSLALQTQQLALQLRAKGKAVEVSLDVKKIGKSFQYAEKKGYVQVLIFGPEEAEQSIYKIKDLLSGEETTHKLTG